MSVGAVNKNTGDRIPTAGNPLDKVGNLASLHTTAKNDAVSAINEVKDEQANKADKDIVADAFSAAETYAEGDYCTYEGGLYKFKTAHEGAWDAADVDRIKIAGELSELKNTLISFPNYSDSGVWLLNDNTNYPYTYTVQSDGFLVFMRCYCSNNNGARLTINGNQMVTCSGNLEFYGGTFPVKKGDILVFSNLSTLSRARLVYAL